jgi:hypothetical protein
MRMLAGLLAAASLVLSFSGANAQPRRIGVQKAVYPHCTRMRDPVACTCALANGGNIGPRGYWYYSSRATPAYLGCMRQAGRA